MSLLIGYPILFDTPRQVRGVPVVESVSSGIRLVTADGEPVRCLWAHDRGAMLASTADKTLAIDVDSLGIRISLTVPDTPVGHELGAALAAGQLGGSFGWQQRHDGGTYRWYCLERPMRREILSATIRELTICCRGAFESTWVTTVGPGLAAKWRRLAMHHVTPRPSARPLTW